MSKPVKKNIAKGVENPNPPPPEMWPHFEIMKMSTRWLVRRRKIFDERLRALAKQRRIWTGIINRPLGELGFQKANQRGLAPRGRRRGRHRTRNRP